MILQISRLATCTARSKSTHEYSVIIIQKAKVPGIARNKAVLENDLMPSKNLLVNMAVQSSSAKLTIASVIAIIGASQKMVAAGLNSVR